MAFQIGDSEANLTELSSLGVVDPKNFHVQYAAYDRLGSGGVRGRGFPSFIWEWGFLPLDQREILRAILPGVTTDVWIVTRTNENTDAYAKYTAVAVWPADEEIFASRRLDFRLEFRHCVLQEYV